MKLKWSDSFDLLVAACGLLDSRFGKVEFDYGVSVLAARTDVKSFPKGSLTFYVGAMEFVRYPDDDVPIGKAIAPIVNLFHEVHGHGGQLLHEFNKNNALSGTLAFNYFACNSSRFYYGVDNEDNPHEHYFKQPHEIAAQYVGIRDTFKFLSEVYDRDTATYMVKDYLYFRLAAGSEFTSRSEFISFVKDRDSIGDVLDRFDETFKSCAKEKHLYEPKFSPNDCVHACANDIGDAWWPRQVASCKSGLRQDVMMTSALFAVDKSYSYALDLKVFEGMDLDAKFIFKQLGKNSRLYESDLGDVDLSMLESYDKADDLSLSSLDVFGL